MTYNELVQEAGLGLAVHLVKNKLPESYFNNLTFEQWIEIYRQSPIESDTELMAQGWLLTKANSFKRWRKIYHLDDRLKKIALNAMQNLASTLDEWLIMASINISFTNQASLKAKTFEEWKKLYNLIEARNMDRKGFSSYIEKMIESAEDFKQLSIVYTCSWSFNDSYYSHRKKIIEKMVVHAKKFEDWCLIFSHADEYRLTEICLKAFAKTLRLARKIDDWIELGRAISKISRLPFEQKYKLVDKFTEAFNRKTESYCFSAKEMLDIYLAVEFLRPRFEKQIIESKHFLDFWFSIYQKIIKGDCFGLDYSAKAKFCEIVFEAITQSEADFEQWANIYRLFVNSDNQIGKLSLQKMIDTASTLNDWLEIYQTGKSNINNKALAQMKKIALETVEIST